MRKATSAAATAGVRPKVLIVEDNSSLRTFLELALQPLNLELLVADSTPSARSLMLQRGPCELILTDLMMPGVTGLELLRELRACEDWRATVPAIVFTANASEQVRAELLPLQVYKIIHKPAALAELISSVKQALADGRQQDKSSPVAGHIMTRDNAVATHFAGNRPLYDAFLSQALAQFSIDVQCGDDASSQSDLPALRLLAHNLKSVLRMLGDDAGSGVAATLENAAASKDLPLAVNKWQTLRNMLEVHIDSH